MKGRDRGVAYRSPPSHTLVELTDLTRLKVRDGDLGHHAMLKIVFNGAVTIFEALPAGEAQDMILAIKTELVEPLRHGNATEIEPIIVDTTHGRLISNIFCAIRD